MKKTSKVLIVLTLGIVISLVLVSAGCLSLFSNPSVSTDTSDNTKVTPKIDTSKIDTSKVLTDNYTYDSKTGKLVKKEKTMAGKWKIALTNNYYDLTMDIKDESSTTYVMTVKDGKSFNELMEVDAFETGDIVDFDCKLVKNADGSYTVKATYCSLLRDGEELASGSSDNDELAVITYDKEKDSLKISAEGETLKMVRTT